MQHRRKQCCDNVSATAARKEQRPSSAPLASAIGQERPSASRAQRFKQRRKKIRTWLIIRQATTWMCRWTASSCDGRLEVAVEPAIFSCYEHLSSLAHDA